MPSRWDKFNRAKQQLAALDDQIGRFAKPANQEPIGIREELDPDKQAYVSTLASVPQSPLDWGLIVGEIVHNFRGALDHLVWDLGILKQRREPMDSKGRPWRTQFPICGGRSNWPTPRIQNMISPLRAKDRARIKGCQPFRKWHGPRPHPLLLLDNLSNADKHRILQPVLLAAGEFSPTIPLAGRNCRIVSGRVAFISGRPLLAETKLVELALEIIGPDPKVDVEFELSAYVGFEDGTSPQDILGDIEGFVKETLDIFEADLTTPRMLSLRNQLAADHRKAPYWIPFSLKRRVAAFASRLERVKSTSTVKG